MKTSVRWLNTYLQPGDVSAEEAERILTHAGFPIETAEAVAFSDGAPDTMIDVEVTSNRGDCLSHIGLAREIAAASGRVLRSPAIPDAVLSAADPASPMITGLPGGAAEQLSVDNQVHDVCPLFTARVIRGVRNGPSPAWLVDALAAIGQRSISAVVDITNFVLFEFGQPLHVFDMATLRPLPGAETPSLVVRYAAPGEKLTLLDGRAVELRDNELVVADGVGAVSLAGVMGGLSTGVTAQTTDIVLEAATWDPVTVRRASRRLALRSDASYRFERTVDPRTIDVAARRAAALILELAGPAAKLVPGVVIAGAHPRAQTRVSMRPARCRSVLGVDIPTSEMVRALRGHEIHIDGDAGPDAPALDCTIPAHRPDLEREIDLIEEVARTCGLDRVPILEKIPVHVAEPQISERATRVLAGVLTSQGFFETVTFSFVSPKHAQPFIPESMAPITLCDERRKADPTLRPSVIPSLLACRRANQDGGASAPGGVRLFELSSVFSQTPAPAKERGREREVRVLSMIADAVPLTPAASSKPLDVRQDAVRLLRGVLEAAAQALGGAAATIALDPTRKPPAGFDPACAASVVLVAGTAGAGGAGGMQGRGTHLGWIGLVSPHVTAQFDVQTPVVAAEVEIAPLLALFPPRSLVRALPAFPGIQRDLSLIVDESTPWADIDRLIAGASLDRLVGHEFVTTFRGPQIGAGKKSATVRLIFRDPARTLRHEEVDPQVDAVVRLAQQKLGAVLRA